MSIQHTVQFTCTEHRTGLLPRQDEYRAPTANGCYFKAKQEGWRIAKRKATCPDCVRTEQPPGTE